MRLTMTIDASLTFAFPVGKPDDVLFWWWRNVASQVCLRRVHSGFRRNIHVRGGEGVTIVLCANCFNSSLATVSKGKAETTSVSAGYAPSPCTKQVAFPLGKLLKPHQTLLTC